MAANSEVFGGLERQGLAESAQTAPTIFQETDGPIFLNWIAVGTDSNLYIAPAIPGGWLQRTRYEGSADDLVAVTPQKARTIMWYLYGDVGDVSSVKIASK